MSALRYVNTSSRTVLGVLKTLLVVYDSFRLLARRYPFWTKVSLPSASTSLRVTTTSTSFVDDRAQNSTRPAPIETASLARGALTKFSDLPFGYCFQFQDHWL